ncbi:DUF423 domain-containing protein [Simiduia litorea]|uniref:DUF423 domain-containing protein n=1 Tax=Simiduia litorea TaxID=1435348 RepID=UPI0036F1FFDC
MPIKNLLILAACTGALAIALGAFGAHGLKSILSPDALATWQTAVFYHLVHSVLLIGICLRLLVDDARRLFIAAYSLCGGILLFSGSLYILALGGPRLFGPVTPIGGVLLIVGWLSIAAYALRLPAPDR